MATQMHSEAQSGTVPLRPFERDTLPKLFFEAIDRFNRADALRFKANGQWQTVSHREIERRVTQLAAALADVGIRKGDRIAMLSENRPEWAITDYAALGLGVTDAPLYPTLPANQVAYILNDCQARAVFLSTQEQLEKVLEIRADVPSLEYIVLFDDTGRGAEGVHRFSDFLQRGQTAIDEGRAGDFRATALGVEPDDLATLIYTSGTTGDPKGVMLTHHNLASNIAAVHQHDVIKLNPGAKVLSFLPLSHVFERMVDYYYWDSGVSIAYAESIDKVADNLLEVQPEYMVSVPRLFEKIYAKVMGATGIKRTLVMWAKGVGEDYAGRQLNGEQIPGALSFKYRIADKLVFSKLRERTGGQLKAAISGGAPLSGEIAKFFFAAGLPVYEGYGLTETSPVLTANRPGAVKLGSVGRVVPGTEIRIDATGEILARGPQVMKGYWNKPDATAEVIDTDGWFHTGDVGEFDAQGFLRITDRIKNLIVTAGGKNIAPQPIENQATMSPFIAQAVMIGDRRNFPTLLVVPDFENLRPWAEQQGIDTSDSQRLAADGRVRQLLESEALGRLEGFARYELPKKVTVLTDEFTVDSGLLTPTMKVKRKAVEQRYSGEIEAMYQGEA
jgi:long-chain acyl-CoA synthetase